MYIICLNLVIYLLLYLMYNVCHDFTVFIIYLLFKKYFQCVTPVWMLVILFWLLNIYYTNIIKKRLCILGIMMCPKTLSETGIELHLATNHLGHFLFTLLLLPRMLKFTPSRIINVTSLAYKCKWNIIGIAITIGLSIFFSIRAFFKHFYDVFLFFSRIKIIHFYSNVF